MGLAPDAFWSLWPRRFDLLVERHREATKRADYRAGRLIALLYNINRDTEKDPDGAKWTDFFPEWEDSEPQTEQQMLDAMMLWARATARVES